MQIWDHTYHNLGTAAAIYYTAVGFKKSNREQKTENRQTEKAMTVPILWAFLINCGQECNKTTLLLISLCVPV